MFFMSDNGGKCNMAIFCGFGGVLISAISTLSLAVVAWWFCLGIFWYIVIWCAILALIVVQVVFMFVLKKLALFVQPAALIAVVALLFLMWFIAPRRYFVSYKYTELNAAKLAVWKSERAVYVFFDQDKPITEVGTEAVLKDDVVKKMIADQLTANKEDIDAKLAKKTMETYKTIEITGITNNKDVELVYKVITNYWLTWTLSRGFIVFKGDGLRDYIVKATDSVVMKKDDFDKKFEERVGEKLTVE